MEAVTTSLVTAITSFAGDAMGAIGSIVPVALPIMGAIVVVGIGIKVFPSSPSNLHVPAAGGRMLPCLYLGGILMSVLSMVLLAFLVFIFFCIGFVR